MRVRRKKDKSLDEAGLNVHVIRYGKTSKRNDVSRQSEDLDDFSTIPSLASTVIAPPYEMQTIATVFERSNILRQCIEAYVTNICKFGLRVIPITENTKIDEKEKEVLESFIQSANTEESLVTVKSKEVYDFEKYGYGYFEVVRNARKVPTLLRHVKSYTMRICSRDEELIPVTVEVARGGSRSSVTEYRRFRKYVQSVSGRQTYFKEFGDPRDMDYRDGRYASRDTPVPKDFLATEILHEKQYSEDAYGIPRWISQMPSILGSRESEEVNLRYFEDNTIPPIMMTVAGGRLTRQSFQNLNKLLTEQGIGRDRQNQIILIEAVPETVGLEDKGTVQIKIDKLTDARPSDGLFKDYDSSNIDKVRSAFRIPSVVIGRADQVNFATASTSLYIAETQVFEPERAVHDEFLNKRFVNHPKGLNLKTVCLQSRGPRVTNPDQVIKTLTAVNVMGGLTPRTAIDLVNETMQLSIPKLPEKGAEGWEEWMDMPISLSQRMAIVTDTQQTGQGDSTHSGQAGKTGKIKSTEATGATGVDSLAVQNGQQ